MPIRAAQGLGLDGMLRRAHAAGTAVSIRRGIYVDPVQLAAATAVELHRLQVLAVSEQRPGAVFAGLSAAVLHGLPVVGAVPPEVVVLANASSGRRRNGVREIVRADDETQVLPNGVAVTPLVTTLIEVARHRHLLTALTMVDAALHTPRFGDRRPLCTLDELRSSFEAMLPFPGSRSVAAVLDRATSRAETPLETLSRVRFEELGFPQPELQTQVWRPRSGRMAFLDFAWPEFGVWGEADGDGKYLGNARRNGDRGDDATIVREEKRRENEVRAVTKWSCARWDWAEAWRAGPLRGILLEAGLPIVKRARRVRVGYADPRRPLRQFVAVCAKRDGAELAELAQRRGTARNADRDQMW